MPRNPPSTRCISRIASSLRRSGIARLPGRIVIRDTVLDEFASCRTRLLGQLSLLPLPVLLAPETIGAVAPGPGALMGYPGSFLRPDLLDAMLGGLRMSPRVPGPLSIVVILWPTHDTSSVSAARASANSAVM